MKKNKDVRLNKETLIRILELDRQILREILQKVEENDSTDGIDMGDEYIANEILKRL